MTDLIKLTRADIAADSTGTNYIYYNPDNITRIYVVSPTSAWGANTTVTVSSGTNFFVKETVDDIILISGLNILNP